MERRAPGYVIEKEGRGSISNGEERWLGREGMGNLVKDDLFVGETKGAFGLSDSLNRSGFPTPRETGRDR